MCVQVTHREDGVRSPESQVTGCYKPPSGHCQEEHLLSDMTSPHGTFHAINRKPFTFANQDKPKQSAFRLSHSKTRFLDTSIGT